jgi:hypothetical protein
LGDPGVDARIIFRGMFRKWDVRAWNGSSWLRVGKGEGTCDCGNEPSGYVKCGKKFDWLKTA